MAFPTSQYDSQIRGEQAPENRAPQVCGVPYSDWNRTFLLCQEAWLGKWRAGCARVQLATWETMHGSLSKKRWKQASEPTILAPTFFGRWLFWVSVFSDLTLSFSGPDAIEWRRANIIHWKAPKKAACDLLLWDKCEGLAFYFHEGMYKGKGFTLCEKMNKELWSMRETKEFSSLKRFWTIHLW